MANITAKDVAALRAKTGCGMMECKKALVEAEGNMDEAVKVLRERGLAVAAKKADRIAAEGIVDILVQDDTAAIIEVNSETDFVGKNEAFRAFVAGILRTILRDEPKDLAALQACKFDDTNDTVEAKIKDMIFTIGENMSIRRFDIVRGELSTYIHGKGSIGVIVAFDADEAAKKAEGFAEMKKNVALHVAAVSAVPYLSRESVPASVVSEEMEILKAQMANDPKFANKPAAAIEKIVQGKLGKFYETNCLLEQEYVKAENKENVAQYIANASKEFGGSISIRSFIRYEKGEGLQKREEDFAAEIEKMVKG